MQEVLREQQFLSLCLPPGAHGVQGISSQALPHLPAQALALTSKGIKDAPLYTFLWPTDEL